MRVDVRKFVFIGPNHLSGAFFNKAQAGGIIEFINKEGKKGSDVEEEVQHLIKADKILRGLPVLEQLEGQRLALADRYAMRILELREEIERLQEEIRPLQQEITRVQVFGDFSKEETASLEKESNRVIQFFFTKHGAHIEAPNRPEVIYIDSANNLDYFISINHEKQSYPGMIEMVIDKPLGQLRKRLDEVNQLIHEKETELKQFAACRQLLQKALIEKLNKFYLRSAKDYIETLENNAVFAIEGWVPSHKLKELHALTKDMAIHCEEIVIEKKDRVPTFLENKGYGLVGEDLVHIYDTPSTSDKDPSWWVLCSFSLFFAMIIGDAGYGLLLLAGALFLRFKFPNAEGAGKRFVKLLLVLSVCCIAWGILTNAFFSCEVGPESPFRKTSLVHWLIEKKTTYLLEHKDGQLFKEWVDKYPQLQTAKNPIEALKIASTTKEGQTSYTMMNKFTGDVMIELAVFVGSLHVILSLLRYLKRNWAAIGWVGFIVGWYLFSPTLLGATSLVHYAFGVDAVKGATFGLQSIYGGLAVAVVLALIQKRLEGILEFMNAIQLFADILSYLRLYALGLAGAIMGATWNEIGGLIGLAFGTIVVVLGHTINLSLGIMGGVIHGLRLNFLEWYHYSFEGGGKIFKPLMLYKKK